MYKLMAEADGASRKKIFLAEEVVAACNNYGHRSSIFKKISQWARIIFYTYEFTFLDAYINVIQRLRDEKR